MKKIITAIGDPFINEKLSEEKEIKIIGKDIFYQDAIFEILEKNKIKNQINFLIINEIIFENSEIIKKISEIKKINKKIKIIIIINKEKNIIKRLKKEKNIYIIYYNKKIKGKINKIINKIINKKYNKKLNEKNLREIIKVIKLIIQNENKKFFYEVNFETKKNNENKKNLKEKMTKIKNILNVNSMKKLIVENLFNEIIKKNFSKLDGFSAGQIITIIGEQNVGKSTVAFQYSNLLQHKNQGKILIIDFNIYNQNLFSKFKKKKYPNKIYQRLVKNNFNKDRPNFNNKKNNDAKEKIKKYYLENYKKIFDDFVIKINNNINLISGLDLILKNNKKIKNNLIINEIKNKLNNYNIIIIYTGEKNELNLNKLLLKISTKILLVIEPELKGIKKGKSILKTVDKNNKNKINIIVNKYNKNSISIYIIKNIFKEIKILKKIIIKSSYKKFNI